MGQICTKGIWDESVPGIEFDKNGISNYARMFQKFTELYPRGDKGLEEWETWVRKIKKDGLKRKYDCIVGVSGGTDSSYLLYLTREYGLRPLAVNLDNGFSSRIAVENIKKVTSALGIDLETYVVDYEEVKAVLRAYIKASLPWIDGPTDLAIKAALYKVAERENVRFIFNGSDFRTEGKQPTEWTYTDARQLLHLINKFERIRLKTFPYYTISRFIRVGYFKRIKMLRPYYYLDYEKRKAQEFLRKEYNWEYYGGHHHENIFTRFALSYWLPKKFGIDKRIISLSALVMNGEITREQGLEELAVEPYDIKDMMYDKEFVLKKLDMTDEEFEKYISSPNKYYYDYPSYMFLLKTFNKLSINSIKKILPFTPSIFIESQSRME
ncbi:MAG: N-acetyl sugar amidotransferase [Bacteroidales bacterium]